MIHIRQPFFSIAAAAIFASLGFAYAVSAVNSTVITLAGTELGTSAAWALSGLLLLMAYFSLVHLKD